MNTTATDNPSAETQRRALSTADIAGATDRASERDERAREERNRSAATAVPIDGKKSAAGEVAELAPLFSADLATEFRSRWDTVQSGFVDDPKQAVREGDELVAEVMKSLADSFPRSARSSKARWTMPTRRPRKICALPCAGTVRSSNACCRYRSLS